MPTSLPELLTDRRTALGLTIYEVADKLDVSWRTVYRWEAGARDAHYRPPNRANCHRLALLYNLNPIHVLYLASVPPTKPETRS